MTDPDPLLEDYRARQIRLAAHMAEQGIDLAIVTRIEHVQYLVGTRFAWTYEPAAALSADGKMLLVAPNQPPAFAAADEMTSYEAQWRCTLRNDQRRASAQALLKALGNKVKSKRVAVEFSCCGPHITQGLSGELVDLEPTLFQMRRTKDASEMFYLRKAIAATGKMYEAAREMIAPGVNELDLFNELQAVAVRELGEMLTGTGNDYRCGAPGGPPRNSQAQDGELYILDLGPAYRGYFADNCRAVCVNDQPTDPQFAAWERLSKVFDMVAAEVKPGKSCKAFFQEVQAYLDEFLPGAFNHHLGHGIGLYPHEAPHLNPDWDDVFQVGDVFTCEPGLYTPELRAGIRLENDYLVTPAGVELLSDFPLHL